MLEKLKTSSDRLLNRRSAVEEGLEKEDLKLRTACEKLFGTPEGVTFLKWFHTSTHIGDLKKSMSPDQALCYRSQQNVYDSIKNYLPLAARIAVELKGAEKNE